MTLSEVQAMTDEERNNEIAELTLWNKCLCKDDGSWCGMWLPKDVPQSRWEEAKVNIPFYTISLESMAEAEKFLDDDNIGDYGIWLERLGDNDGMTATASQRATCFILAMTGVSS